MKFFVLKYYNRRSRYRRLFSTNLDMERNDVPFIDLQIDQE